MQENTNHQKNLQSLALPEDLLSLYKMLDLVYVYNPSNTYDRYPIAAGAVVHDITPTGGILAGGVGLQTFSDVVEVDGGMLAGGVALQTITYNHNLVLKDPSGEVWLSNHLGLIYIYDNINHDDEFETIIYTSRF
ncbi:hypothetical protein EBU95_20995, partial [bacterium]|nr:hypothetical protein [bacterium]